MKIMPPVGSRLQDCTLYLHVPYILCNGVCFKKQSITLSLAAIFENRTAIFVVGQISDVPIYIANNVLKGTL